MAKTISEILAKLPAYSSDVLTPDEVLIMFPELKQALQQLTDYVEQIIGVDEDEEARPKAHPVFGNAHAIVRNQLRQEQRKKLRSQE